ncbi:MAG TPA: cobalamin-dependent protein [Thermoanaerobaculia bacterium]|nr:cobalamin-dependent protein [Thermoanaerobaculia bacterium]
MESRNVDLNAAASRALDSKRDVLAEAMTALHYQLQPDLAVRYGEAGRAKCLQDAYYHLSYLADSIAADSPSLFADYVAWAKVMLGSRGIPAADLAVNLNVLRDVLRQHLPGDLALLATVYVESGLEQLPSLPAEVPSALQEGEPLSSLARRYIGALLAGERHVASRLVLEAVAEQGVSVRDIYLHVFQPAQHEVGRLWQMNRLSVAQEHYCTAATQLIMSQLYPYLFSTERNGHAMVATCVSGDLHEIGVRMVSDFFEMEGWDTFYLGASTPTPSLLQTLAQRRADVLAVSATLTSHVRAVTELIRAVRASEAGEQVKIMVGGYPFNVAPELWKQVGADASARNAEDAIVTARRLADAPDSVGARR